MTDPRDPAAPGAEPASVAEGPSETTAAGSSSPSETELRTFLIADIRGYTTYTREHGDEAAAALASRFAELVGEVVTARDGFLLELRGDEALVVFVSARKALRAAIDLQARFVEAELPRGVGIGLDAGEAIPVGDGYRGTALNLAARLCAQAGPGETLASEAVIHLAAKMDGIAYVDPRSLKLKGYADSVRAVVVVPSDRAKGRRLASGNGSRGADRRILAIAGVAVVVVALLAGVVGGGLLGRGGSTSPGASGLSGATGSPGAGGALAGSSPGASPGALAEADLPLLAFYDAGTGKLEATAPLAAPTNISIFSDGSFWVLGENPKAFNRIDPATRKIVQSIPIPAVEARGYAFGEGSIWVTDGAGPHVIRIDERTGVVTTIPFGAGPSDTQPALDVVVGAGSVWMTRPDTGEIIRLDPRTGKVQARIPDVNAFGIAFGEGAPWYTTGEGLGRIDPSTNAKSFDPVLLAPNSRLANIAFGGGDAWTAESSTGHVWRVDRAGRQSSYSLPAGVGELSATDDTMWVTNVNTGQLTGIDLVTGTPDRKIDTGHATLSVAAGGGQIMVAVGPTVADVLGGLDGSVLTITTTGVPWGDPGPDPAVNWYQQARQALYVTCVALVNYPDKPAPDGWTLEPEAATGMPTVSPDGRTYTFTIKPGFAFSPPSNEPVTAETFRATFERALSPILGDDAPGPSFLGDIVGVKDYRSGKTDHVAGLVASGDRLTVSLEAPAPDLLNRLALSFFCPVPVGTPMLRDGVDPDPPIGGAGPYYLAQKIKSRLALLKKNPNYHGTRPQPFDAIAIEVRDSTPTAIGKVEQGTIDAAMLENGQALSNLSSTIAKDWGPGSANAAAGDQRWFGGPRFGVFYLALNPSRPVFRDQDLRRAASLAIDRAALVKAWSETATAELLVPSVPGTKGPEAPVPAPDLDAARALLKGRTPSITLQGFPTEWDCAQCRDFDTTLVDQLKAAGFIVKVAQGSDYPGSAMDPGSKVDLISLGSGTEYPDPVVLMGMQDVPWIGKANLREYQRLLTLDGQARIDGAVAFADRLMQEQTLILPYGYPVYPFFVSERIGCGFVQPAIGAVDLLSLCLKDASATPAASPDASIGP